MITVDLKSLIAKLNNPCRQALEAAAGLAVSRSHYNIEIEHWLLKLLDIRDSDIIACLANYGVEPGAVAADLNRVLDKQKTGSSRAPGLSPEVVQWAREAWLLASLSGNAPIIRSGHLLAALLGDDHLAAIAREASRSLGAIPGEALRNQLGKITAGSAEAGSVAAPSAARDAATG